MAGPESPKLLTSHIVPSGSVNVSPIANFINSGTELSKFVLAAAVAGIGFGGDSCAGFTGDWILLIFETDGLTFRFLFGNNSDKLNSCAVSASGKIIALLYSNLIDLR